MKLSDILKSQNNSAIGHFNVSNWEGVKAVQEVCQQTNTPIIIGLSQGEAGFMGIETMAAVVRAFREKLGLPVFLNADHFKDMGLIEAAARAGFDSILFDAATESFEQNIVATKQAVEVIKQINQDILVEGELGYIGVGSIVRSEVPEGAVIEEDKMITPEQAKEFVARTGVDLIGPAVGNIHGIVRGYVETINYDRILAIRQAANVPLVLHGASGINHDLIRSAVRAGISIVHINTELRLAWKESAVKSLADSGEEIAPYKILGSVVESIKQVIVEKLAVFKG